MAEHFMSAKPQRIPEALQCWIASLILSPPASLRSLTCCKIGLTLYHYTSNVEEAKTYLNQAVSTLAIVRRGGGGGGCEWRTWAHTKVHNALPTRDGDRGRVTRITHRECHMCVYVYICVHICTATHTSLHMLMSSRTSSHSHAYTQIVTHTHYTCIHTYTLHLHAYYRLFTALAILHMLPNRLYPFVYQGWLAYLQCVLLCLVS